jgi:tetratricopeptide (TPR) repeat protein
MAANRGTSEEEITMRFIRALGMRVISLACVLTVQAGLAVRADEPARKPPWQRLLQGNDVKKVAEQEKKLAQLQEAGQFVEALKLAEAVAELRAKAQGEDHWQAVNARFEVEALSRVQRAKKEEQQSYSRSFAMQREAEALGVKGRFREAHPLLVQVLAIRRKVLGEEHSETATSYNSLADIRNAQGKYPEAEEGHRMALAIFRKVLGEEHPLTAASYNSLAFNQYSQGKFQEAEEGYRKALAIRRKVLGEEHRDTALSYNNMAANLYSQGKYQEAEEGFLKALAICRKVLGEAQPDTALSYNSVAFTLNAQGKYQEAEKYFGFAAGSFTKARIAVAATGLERATFTSERSPLPQLAAVLARNGKPEAAWQRFEESLARGISDDLACRIRLLQHERDQKAQIAARIDRFNKLLEQPNAATPQQNEQRDKWASSQLQPERACSPWPIRSLKQPLTKRNRRRCRPAVCC